MKLQTIINSTQSLRNLMAEKLPIKVSYRLSKLVIKIQPELTVYDEQRMKLVKELGTEENGSWVVSPENITKFTDELAKLQELEVDLKFGEDKEFEKISMEDLGDIKISSEDMVNLNWLFE